MEQLYKLKDLYLEGKLVLRKSDADQMALIDSIHRNPCFLIQNDKISTLAASNPWPKVLQQLRPKQYDWEWSKLLLRLGLFF